MDPNDRWHDHDADEIQQHADACIEEASKELEKAGWAKESVKVVGEFPLSVWIQHDRAIIGVMGSSCDDQPRLFLNPTHRPI